MLTDHFINLCCLILVSDHPKFTDNINSDIGEILDFYKEEDVALQFRKKFSLAKSLYRLKSDGMEPHTILDSIISANHYSELSSFIEMLSIRKIPDEKSDAAINQICDKKQLIKLQKDLPQIEEFISKFNTNSFTAVDEILDHWNSMISSVHSNILEEKRKNARSGIKELDLLSDDYVDVLNQIEISYSGINSVSTGYSELDQYLNGGHEPNRLYIYGGCSGDGKSILLINFLRNAVENNKDKTGPVSMFIYFTMENLIDESLIRLYCSIEDKDIKDVIKHYAEEKMTIQQKIKDWQIKHNAMICMSYFPPTLTSVSDLISYCDVVKSRYDERAILRGVYTDYLDLLKSGKNFDLHRLELGQVTIDMKVAAVVQGVPWLTVTQLNRSIFIKSIINIKGIGNTTLDTVKVGDMVEGKNNEWRTVKYVFPHENKKCYKITTKSGKTIICGPKHEFPTTDGLKNIQYTGLKVGDKLYVKNDDY